MRRVIRDMFFGAGVFLSVAGFLLFISVGVGIWWVKAEANRRTDALASKANTAVDTVDRAVGFVRGVIAQADRDLEETRKVPRESTTPVNPFARAAARQASQNLAGSVERANTAIITAADAVEVAKTALNFFEEDEPVEGLKNWLGFGPEQVARTRNDLGGFTRELEQVRTLLGVPLNDGTRPTEEQLRTVESALGQASSLTEQMGSVVANTRARVNETKQSVDSWVRRLTLGITFFSFLGAAGQFFMLRFFWGRLRGWAV